MEESIRNLEHRLRGGDLSAAYPLTRQYLRRNDLLSACDLGDNFYQEGLHNWRLFLMQLSGGVLPLCEVKKIILTYLSSPFQLNPTNVCTFQQSFPESPFENTIWFNFGFRSQELDHLIPKEWLRPEPTREGEKTVIGDMSPGHVIEIHDFENPDHLNVDAWLGIYFDITGRPLTDTGFNIALVQITDYLNYLGQALLNYGWYCHIEHEDPGDNILIEPVKDIKNSGLHLLYKNTSGGGVVPVLGWDV